MKVERLTLDTNNIIFTSIVRKSKTFIEPLLRDR